VKAPGSPPLKSVEHAETVLNGNEDKEKFYEDLKKRLQDLYNGMEDKD
jgi:hypothetical protein